MVSPICFILRRLLDDAHGASYVCPVAALEDVQPNDFSDLEAQVEMEDLFRGEVFGMPNCAQFHDHSANVRQAGETSERMLTEVLATQELFQHNPYPFRARRIFDHGASLKYAESGACESRDSCLSLHVVAALNSGSFVVRQATIVRILAWRFYAGSRVSVKWRRDLTRISFSSFQYLSVLHWDSLAGTTTAFILVSQRCRHGVQAVNGPHHHTP
jgi:hypothetical protein